MIEMTDYEKADINIKDNQFRFEKRKLWLTAFLATIITLVLGNCLQQSSFRKNELFKAKLESINKGQDEAKLIRQQTEDLLGVVRRIQERYGNQTTPEAKFQYCTNNKSNLKTSVESLKSIRQKTNFLKDYEKDDSSSNLDSKSKSKSNSNANTFKLRKTELNEKVENYETNFLAYLDCAEKYDCSPCSTQADNVAISLTDVVAFYSTQRNALLEGVDSWF